MFMLLVLDPNSYTVSTCTICSPVVGSDDPRVVTQGQLLRRDVRVVGYLRADHGASICFPIVQH